MSHRFVLSEWRDVKTQKSRLKYETKYDLYYIAQQTNKN